MVNNPILSKTKERKIQKKHFKNESKKAKNNDFKNESKKAKFNDFENEIMNNQYSKIKKNHSVFKKSSNKTIVSNNFIDFNSLTPESDSAEKDNEKFCSEKICSEKFLDKKLNDQNIKEKKLNDQNIKEKKLNKDNYICEKTKIKDKIYSKDQNKQKNMKLKSILKESSNNSLKESSNNFSKEFSNNSFKKIVSFDSNVQIKLIKSNNLTNYEIKDKKIILRNSFVKKVKKAKNYFSKILSNNSVILKYSDFCKINSDLRLMGLLEKSYIENKVIVSGIGFRETEESVSEYFNQFGKVTKVILEKNNSGWCTGKGTVTFSTNINRNQEFILNNRILHLEIIKKELKNLTRCFISHMDKDINISKLRQILKENGFVAKNIRIDLMNGKNLGYGFVEFGSPEHAERFLENYTFISKSIGCSSYAEYSKEKK